MVTGGVTVVAVWIGGVVIGWASAGDAIVERVTMREAAFVMAVSSPAILAIAGEAFILWMGLEQLRITARALSIIVVTV